MTEIEQALVHYDGDNSKPYCDLVYKALKTLQNVEKRSVLSAEQLIMSLAKKKYLARELNNDYWCAEWSWQPICDGMFPYKETLRFAQTFVVRMSEQGIYGTCTYECHVYQTGKNNRYYFPWEVFDSEDDARTACRIFGSWAYDYDIARQKVLPWLIEKSGITFVDKSINGLHIQTNH